MASRSRTITVVFVSLILDLLGFTVILPLLPSLLEYYSKSEDPTLASFVGVVDSFRTYIGAPGAEKFNLVLLGGFLGSLFSLLQFLVSPVIGTVSDVYGRKPILLLSMVGVAVSYLIWALSRNFTVFVIARVLGGASKGNINLSTAIVTDVTTPEKRSRGMAMIGVAFSLGFIFGPIIGAAFSIAGKNSSFSDPFATFQYPAIFALVLGVLDILFVAFMFEESLPVPERCKIQSSEGSGLSRALKLINPISLFRFDAVNSITTRDLRSLRLLSLGYFIYILLFSGLEYSLTFLVHQRFNYTSMQQGKMFFYIGVTMALVQGGYMRRRPPGSEKATALRGITAIVPGMVIVGFAYNVYALYFGLFLYSFGAGTVVPTLTAIASTFGSDDEKGKVMGIFRSIGALARAVGPFLSCLVYWSYSAEVCYLTGGVLLGLPYLLVSIAKKKSD